MRFVVMRVFFLLHNRGPIQDRRFRRSAFRIVSHSQESSGQEQQESYLERTSRFRCETIAESMVMCSAQRSAVFWNLVDLCGIRLQGN